MIDSASEQSNSPQSSAATAEESSEKSFDRKSSKEVDNIQEESVILTSSYVANEPVSPSSDKASEEKTVSVSPSAGQTKPTSPAAGQNKPVSQAGGPTSTVSIDASAIDTSLFDLSDDDIDRDSMTWRPLRLTPNGVFQTDASEIISTSSGNGETVVTVLSSDSWIPNAGPIMKERD
jgi:hypothetical protein